MKKIIAAAAFFMVISFQAFSQDYVMPKQNFVATKPSTFFLGFGGGINNPLGLLGVSLEFKPVDKFTIFGGAGLGSWGNKVSAGVRYYTDFPNSWAFGVGISSSTGLDKLEMNMPGEYIVGGSPGNTYPTSMRLKSAQTLNISALKFWSLGKSGNNRFNIELGYAAKMGSNPYSNLDNYTLTPSGHQFMDIMRPGGVILGLGFTFGLN